MNSEQLELWRANPDPERLSPRRRRLARAKWWFERMHRVVDAAKVWRPTPLPPPEQGALPLEPRRAGA